MLAAMRDENLLGIAGHAERCQPADDGVAVLAEALVRQIAEQIRYFAGGDDIADRRCDHVVLAGVGRHIEREVDGGFRRAERGALFRPAALNEGATSDLSRDQAALLGLGIGFRHRSDAEAEALRHIALGQKPHAGLDAAGANIGIQCQHEGEVARAQDRFEVRNPVGHRGSFSKACIRKANIVRLENSTIFELMQCWLHYLYHLYDEK